MKPHANELRALLHKHNLRATAPRIAVLSALSEAGRPLSHTEVLNRLDTMQWDRSTIYRNLIRLCATSLVTMVGRIDGADRYAIASPQANGHHHPHFFCSKCVKVICLPECSFTLPPDAGAGWAGALQEASVHFNGVCPSCRNGS